MRRTKEPPRENLWGEKVQPPKQGMKAAMDGVFKNYSTILKPMFTEWGYEFYFFAFEGLNPRQTPYQTDIEKWEALGKHKSAMCKIHPKGEPGNSRLIQIFKMFSSVTKFGNRDYPHINISGRFMDNYPDSSEEMRSALKTYYNTHNGGILWLCNTNTSFVLGNYIYIIDDMLWTPRNKKGRNNRLRITSEERLKHEIHMGTEERLHIQINKLFKK